MRSRLRHVSSELIVHDDIFDTCRHVHAGYSSLELAAMRPRLLDYI
jgi:hypothetical protein